MEICPDAPPPKYMMATEFLAKKEESSIPPPIPRKKQIEKAGHEIAKYGLDCHMLRTYFHGSIPIKGLSSIISLKRNSTVC